MAMSRGNGSFDWKGEEGSQRHAWGAVWMVLRNADFSAVSCFRFPEQPIPPRAKTDPAQWVPIYILLLTGQCTHSPVPHGTDPAGQILPTSAPWAARAFAGAALTRVSVGSRHLVISTRRRHRPPEGTRARRVGCFWPPPGHGPRRWSL